MVSSICSSSLVFAQATSNRTAIIRIAEKRIIFTPFIVASAEDQILHPESHISDPPAVKLHHPA